MPYTIESHILGPNHASQEQCARFISARPHGDYTEYDIRRVIVPAYFRIAQSVGLDPVIAIAQLIHETGNLTSWWAQRPRRNPAGIGVTGQQSVRRPPSGSWVWNENTNRWHEGVAFTTWDKDAIPAHVGRLLAYALRDEQASPAQSRLITQALTFRPLSRYRGEARLLQNLNGRWAVPGATYADKLAAVASTIARM
ncbi:hypothetical protein F8S13_24515 [Chloroflexia bacterium SDU3-3]|nr:hypothetical protein F8S13_24515 [Chloroflexia bacterium SDU3-3]